MFELGRILQLMGLVVVPMAFLWPRPLIMFGVLIVGAALFLIGRYLVDNSG